MTDTTGLTLPGLDPGGLAPGAADLPGPARRPGARNRWLAVFRTPIGAASAFSLLLVLGLAVVAPIIWTHRANRTHLDATLQPPSATYWAGTDNLGRDIFYRVLVASRLSIELALLATLIAVVAGLLLGTVGVVLGRRVARLVSAVVGISVAFPGILLALFFAVIFGVGTKGAVLAIGIAGAPSFARLTQTLTAGIEQRDFVAAARIAGVSRTRILTRHVLPNIAEPLIVNAAIGAGGALLAFASLSFLGIGVQSPSYDWGLLLGTGLAGIYEDPVAALAPGIALIVAGLAFNFFGESLAKGIGLKTVLGRTPLTRTRIRPVAQAGEEAAPAAADESCVLDVEDLVVTFPGANAPVSPVRGVSFRLGRGEAVGVVGESGSGKSLTALAVAGLIERPGRIDAARLRFLGHDLRDGPARHRRLLGTSFAMVFQDPMSSLNPTRRVGSQLAELAREHGGLARRAAHERAVDRLRAVRVPAPQRRARQYPHEFSGGMRQRAMIGLGLMNSPALIVADEPTTALDVTVQRQMLDLLQSIRRADDVALLLISHDISVVGQVCDRVIVMYAGRVVEDLPVTALRAPRHPYTRALIDAVPDMSTELDRPIRVIPGRAADPADLPPGCAFAPRCPLATERCTVEDPALQTDASGHRVACWHADAVPAGVS